MSLWFQAGWPLQLFWPSEAHRSSVKQACMIKSIFMVILNGTLYMWQGAYVMWETPWCWIFMYEIRVGAYTTLLYVFIFFIYCFLRTFFGYYCGLDFFFNIYGYKYHILIPLSLSDVFATCGFCPYSTIRSIHDGNLVLYLVLSFLIRILSTIGTLILQSISLHLSLHCSPCL